MKLFRFLPILFLGFPVLTADGQTRPNKSAVKGKACKVNTVAFPCLKGFVVKSVGSNEAFAAYNAKTGVGIYAFNPTGNLSEENLIAETLKSALKSLYLTDYQDYEWKNSDDFADNSSWSKYEKAKFAKAGFSKNKRQTVHLQMVRLSYKDKDILVGFVYELAKGQTAEKTFTEWSGGGNGEASDALQDLIDKITGEKSTNETPGGPPPMAMPKN